MPEKNEKISFEVPKGYKARLKAKAKKIDSDVSKEMRKLALKWLGKSR